MPNCTTVVQTASDLFKPEIRLNSSKNDTFRPYIRLKNLLKFLGIVQLKEHAPGAPLIQCSGGYTRMVDNSIFRKVFWYLHLKICTAIAYST